ncbi:MAG: polyprenyl synthetase family protein [Candidatus Aminicenantes bacterium]|nr:polyprenyl synthetase family protein [Candidatus Aminicenantes bacterium]
MRKATKEFIKTEVERNLTLRELYSDIRQDLNEVENKLKLFTQSPNPIISEISSYLFRKAGKRIRPALLVLCSRLLGYKGTEHILLSALVETIHTASLIHDDIIDNSDVRRGMPTVHAKWGSNITVLLGDYLYIRTLHLSLQSKHSEIIQILTEISAQMIEGELHEYYMSGNLELEETDYLDILNKKTASLFSASCLMGAVLSGSSDKEKNILAEFGQNLGMSFQITDDLLDYTGDEKKLGKPVLSDLEEGRITLPLIYTLNNDGHANRKRLKKLLQQGHFENGVREEILHIVKSNGALDYTLKMAKSYSNKSKEIIGQFPKSIYRDTLSMIPDFVISRSQ